MTDLTIAEETILIKRIQLLEEKIAVVIKNCLPYSYDLPYSYEYKFIQQEEFIKAYECLRKELVDLNSTIKITITLLPKYKIDDKPIEIYIPILKQLFLITTPISNFKLVMKNFKEKHKDSYEQLIKSIPTIENNIDCLLTETSKARINYLTKYKEQIDLDPQGITSQPWLNISLVITQQIGNYHNTKLLQETLARYHAIKVEDRSQLSSRITLLLSLQKLATEMLQQCSSRKEEYMFFLQLSKQAYSKALYLQILDEIEPHNVKEALQNISGSIVGFRVKTNPNIIRSDGSRQYEIDPCFRGNYSEHFATLWSEWESSKSESTSSSFLLWLESKDEETKKIIPPDDDYRLVVDGFCSQHSKLLSINKTIIDKHEGVVKNYKEELVCCKEILYVIDPYGVLYLGLHNPFNHHPYVARDAKSVLCAGVISLKNGKITYIDNYSGHYKPSSLQLRQATFLLLDRNLLDENVTIIIIKFIDGKQDNTRLSKKNIIAEKAALTIQKSWYEHKIRDQINKQQTVKCIP